MNETAKCNAPDCFGICNGPALWDCAGTCYNPLTENPPHVKDQKGKCIPYKDIGKCCDNKEPYFFIPKIIEDDDENKKLVYLILFVVLIVLIIKFFNFFDSDRRLFK